MGLWSAQLPSNLSGRSPSSVLDCQQIVREITTAQERTGQETTALFKFRNKIWNRIISNQEFDHFKDNEYLKWQEIYKDSSNDLTRLNPVSLEQKLALIEVINAKTLASIDMPLPSLKSDIQKLSGLKLKKLGAHLEKMDLSSKLTRDDLEEFAADLFIILKGPPVSLLDYFTKNKSKTMNRRLFRTVQEDMLVMGLRGISQRIPEKESYQSMENGKYLIKKFFQHKAWKYLVMPYDLPWFEKLKIPEELLEKILLDGLSQHNEELITHLKSQSMIDHYERFRKVYRPVAFSLGFAFYYQKFDKKYEEQVHSNQEEAKQELRDSFEILGEAIKDNYNESQDNMEVIKAQQLSRMIDQYRFKYGMDPTSAEYLELREKVYRQGH